MFSFRLFDDLLAINDSTDEDNARLRSQKVGVVTSEFESGGRFFGTPK